MKNFQSSTENNTNHSNLVFPEKQSNDIYVSRYNFLEQFLNNSLYPNNSFARIVSMIRDKSKAKYFEYFKAMLLENFSILEYCIQEETESDTVADKNFKYFKPMLLEKFSVLESCRQEETESDTVADKKLASLAQSFKYSINSESIKKEILSLIEKSNQDSETENFLKCILNEFIDSILLNSKEHILSVLTLEKMFPIDHDTGIKFYTEDMDSEVSGSSSNKKESVAVNEVSESSSSKKESVAVNEVSESSSSKKESVAVNEVSESSSSKKESVAVNEEEKRSSNDVKFNQNKSKKNKSNQKDDNQLDMDSEVSESSSNKKESVAVNEEEKRSSNDVKFNQNKSKKNKSKKNKSNQKKHNQLGIDSEVSGSRVVDVNEGEKRKLILNLKEQTLELFKEILRREQKPLKDTHVELYRTIKKHCLLMFLSLRDESIVSVSKHNEDYEQIEPRLNKVINNLEDLKKNISSVCQDINHSKVEADFKTMKEDFDWLIKEVMNSINLLQPKDLYQLIINGGKDYKLLLESVRSLYTNKDGVFNSNTTKKKSPESADDDNNFIEDLNAAYYEISKNFSEVFFSKIPSEEIKSMIEKLLDNIENQLQDSKKTFDTTHMEIMESLRKKGMTNDKEKLRAIKQEHISSENNIKSFISACRLASQEMYPNNQSVEVLLNVFPLMFDRLNKVIQHRLLFIIFHLESINNFAKNGSSKYEISKLINELKIRSKYTCDKIEQIFVGEQISENSQTTQAESKEFFDQVDDGVSDPERNLTIMIKNLIETCNTIGLKKHTNKSVNLDRLLNRLDEINKKCFDSIYEFLEKISQNQSMLFSEKNKIYYFIGKITSNMIDIKTTLEDDFPINQAEDFLKKKLSTMVDIDKSIKRELFCLNSKTKDIARIRSYLNSIKNFVDEFYVAYEHENRRIKSSKIKTSENFLTPAKPIVSYIDEFIVKINSLSYSDLLRFDSQIREIFEKTKIFIENDDYFSLALSVHNFLDIEKNEYQETESQEIPHQDANFISQDQRLFDDSNIISNITVFLKEYKKSSHSDLLKKKFEDEINVNGINLDTKLLKNIKKFLVQTGELEEKIYSKILDFVNNKFLPLINKSSSLPKPSFDYVCFRIYNSITLMWYVLKLGKTLGISQKKEEKLNLSSLECVKRLIDSLRKESNLLITIQEEIEQEFDQISKIMYPTNFSEAVEKIKQIAETSKQVEDLQPKIEKDEEKLKKEIQEFKEEFQKSKKDISVILKQEKLSKEYKIILKSLKSDFHLLTLLADKYIEPELGEIVKSQNYDFKHWFSRSKQAMEAIIKSTQFMFTLFDKSSEHFQCQDLSLLYTIAQKIEQEVVTICIAINESPIIENIINNLWHEETKTLRRDIKQWKNFISSIKDENIINKDEIEKQEQLAKPIVEAFEQTHDFLKLISHCTGEFTTYPPVLLSLMCQCPDTYDELNPIMKSYTEFTQLNLQDKFHHYHKLFEQINKTNFMLKFKKWSIDMKLIPETTVYEFDIKKHSDHLKASNPLGGLPVMKESTAEKTSESNQEPSTHCSGSSSASAFDIPSLSEK